MAEETDLHDLVAAELASPVDIRVSAMAAAIAAHYPGAARAVLFYGSCLRLEQLDGQMLDFYLIVSDYQAAYGRGWLEAANRMIPPNVFPFRNGDLAAKYAVLSEDDLMRECGPEARSVSVWARFAQPARLVWSGGEPAREKTVRSIARAAPTLLALARPMADRSDILDIWKKGFSLTYGCELRAERDDRSASVVDADPARYRGFGNAAAAQVRQPSSITSQDAIRVWAKLRFRGKWLSVARLAKASFTFAGGLDYLAWKVSRHSGVPVPIRSWHRRWPLVAAVILLPRLLARGAVR